MDPQPISVDEDSWRTFTDRDAHQARLAAELAADTASPGEW